jgi:beta-phosphoglucomutase
MASANIRAVLFDFDGTLCDSEHLHHEAWLEAAEPWGVAVGWEEYTQRFIGISDRNAARIFLEKSGQDATEELIDAGCQRKHECYRRRSAAELKVDSRVCDWVRSVSAKVPIGVVSSSATPDVVPILENHGIADAMRFVICGEHVTRLKPDPMPYALALEKLREIVEVDRAGDCLAFEDSNSGVASATAVGLTVHRLDSPTKLGDALAHWERKISALRD